jgi:hypothetical protein
MREDITLLTIFILIIAVSSQALVLNYRKNMAMISKGILKGKDIQKRREQFYLTSGLVSFGVGIGFLIAMEKMYIKDLSLPGGIFFGIGIALFLSYFVVKEGKQAKNEKRKRKR